MKFNNNITICLYMVCKVNKNETSRRLENRCVGRITVMNGFPAANGVDAVMAIMSYGKGSWSRAGGKIAEKDSNDIPNLTIGTKSHFL